MLSNKGFGYDFKGCKLVCVSVGTHSKHKELTASFNEVETNITAAAIDFFEHYKGILAKTVSSKSKKLRCNRSNSDTGRVAVRSHTCCCR